MSKGSISASTFTLKMTAPPRLERPSTSRNPSPSATVRESVFPAIWDFDPASVAREQSNGKGRIPGVASDFITGSSMISDLMFMSR